MNLIKTADGKYMPAYPADWDESKKIPVGSEVKATRARNPEFHRKFFALLKLGFENQDKFQDTEIYRQVVTMKAGFVHFVEGTDGKQHPLPKSIAFDKMQQAEFEKLYYAVLEVIGKEAQLTQKQIEDELINFY